MNVGIDQLNNESQKVDRTAEVNAGRIPVTFKLAGVLGSDTSTKPMGNMPSARTVKTGLR